MHRFPSDFDVESFHFAELEMVCVAANAMYLHLGRDLTLTVLGEFELRPPGVGASAWSGFPLQRCDLVQLIGSRVTEAKVIEETSLSLTFSNGAILRVHADEHYECIRDQAR